MVLGSDYKNTLLKYISHDQLPSFLGGTCTCAHMSGGCVPSPFEHMVANHSAFRYKTSLKKSKAEHEHLIKLQESNTVNFKYEAKSKISFTILKDSK